MVPSDVTYDVASATVKSGGLIAYPTDTVYGLGCDPKNETAVDRLFMVKGRGTKPVPVLCSSMDVAKSLVDLGPLGKELAERFWPGALTIVAPMVVGLPEKIHQGSRTLGVRVPSSAVCLTLLERCGGFLTGTSANRSGAPSCRSADEVLDQLDGSIDLVVDGGLLEGEASTVVSVMGGELTILRTGPVRVPDELMRRRT